MIELELKTGDVLVVENVLDSLTPEQKAQCVSYLVESLLEQPFQVKRALVNAFGIANYYYDDALRKALETIVTAR